MNTQGLNWGSLRLLRGSQQTAFEELCCQLARGDCRDETRFRRIGSPDAGVEAYCTEPDGAEWGWQAKFFERPPDDGRWRQIDESVHRALGSHARLIRYTICLPIDRADPRLPDRASFMEQWDRHVEKWQGWARDEVGHDVEFDYWGNSEILDRLASPKHEGRARFWFDRDLVFGPNWLRARRDEVFANTRPRYPAPVRVDVALGDRFDGLLRHDRFFERLSRAMMQIREKYAGAAAVELDLVPDDQEAVRHAIDDLEAVALDRHVPATQAIPLEAAGARASAAWRALDRVIHAIDEAEARRTSDVREKSPSTPRRRRHATPPQPVTPDRSWTRYAFSELRRELEDLAYLAESSDLRLANAAALLLRGDAGYGKSELLREQVGSAVDEGHVAVLLAGKQFNDGDEPWHQISERLQTTFHGVDEFLGALSAAAEVTGQRALVAIDALNEGAGPRLWPRFFAGMLVTVRRYPWVALAVSFRTNYEQLLIPTGLDPQAAIRVTHHGFLGREYIATNAFFTHFKVRPPSTPLLVPEFSNPLFLMLFCLGLQRRDLREVPSGLEGVESVFSFFLITANEIISDRLGMARDRALVQAAAGRLAAAMAESNEQRLSSVQGRDVVNAGLPAVSDQESLYQAMLDEGVLEEDVVRLGPNRHEVFVSFAYNRLADHEIVRVLLDKHFNPNDISASLGPTTPLGRVVGDDARGSWSRVGELEALLVQLPERTATEIFDAVPGTLGSERVRSAFLRSIVWRRSTTITNRTLDLALECARTSGVDTRSYFASLLMLAARPGHPMNADLLHAVLSDADLSRRDATWTAWVMDEYEAEGPLVRRLVEWAETPQQHESVEDETVRLVGVAVAWLLASSHRGLRDRATKALVRVFESRSDVLVGVLERFTSINDPYVVERLYAVACGVALRTDDRIAIVALADAAFRLVFEAGAPPHLLLRDYARQIIERAANVGAKLGFDLARARPPYGAVWPGMAMRPAEEIEARIPLEEIRERAGEHAIHSSVLGFGDFARYVVGTNTPHFPWINAPFGGKLPRTRKQLVEAFLRSLSPKQRAALRRYEHAQDLDLMTRGQRTAAKQLGMTRAAIRTESGRAHRALRRVLGNAKWNRFHVEFREQLQGGREPWEFDLRLIQRWIYQRVMELGWTSDLFGEIDTLAGYDRHEHRRERIGKKYQWIAYHECLARIADNFRFRGDWQLRDKEYDGPYQIPHGRDIDPSLLLSVVPQLSAFADTTEAWWTPAAHPNWTGEDDVAWIRDAEVPSVQKVVAVTNPSDHTEWLCADIDLQWTFPHVDSGIRRDQIQRNMALQFTGYAIQRQDVDAFLAWERRTRIVRTSMPGHDSAFGDVFIGEYPWAASYRAQRPDDSPDGWDELQDAPARVRPLTEMYHAGDEYDASVLEAFTIILPARWLVEGMALSWRAEEGRWFDREGRLVAFDPSLREAGTRTLLLRTDSFTEFLRREGLEMVWVLQGVKRLFTEPGRGDYPGELEIGGFAQLGPPWKGRVSARYLTLAELQSRNYQGAAEPTGDLRLDRDEAAPGDS